MKDRGWPRVDGVWDRQLKVIDVYLGRAAECHRSDAALRLITDLPWRQRIAAIGEVTCTMGSNGVGNTLFVILPGHACSAGVLADGADVTRLSWPAGKSRGWLCAAGALYFLMLTARENQKQALAVGWRRQFDEITFVSGAQNHA